MKPTERIAQLCVEAFDALKEETRQKMTSNESAPSMKEFDEFMGQEPNLLVAMATAADGLAIKLYLNEEHERRAKFETDVLDQLRVLQSERIR